MYKMADQWRIAKTPTGRNVFSSWVDKSTKTVPFINSPGQQNDLLPDNVETVFSPFSISLSNWADTLKTETKFMPIPPPWATDTAHPWQAITRIAPAPFPEEPPPATDSDAVPPEPMDDTTPKELVTSEPPPPNYILVDDKTTLAPNNDRPRDTASEKKARVEQEPTTSLIEAGLPRPAPRQHIYAQLVKRDFGTGTQWLLDETTLPVLPTLQLMDLHHHAPVDASQMDQTTLEVMTEESGQEEVPLLSMLLSEPEPKISEPVEPLPEATTERSNQNEPQQETTTERSDQNEPLPTLVANQAQPALVNPWSEASLPEMASPPIKPTLLEETLTCTPAPRVESIQAVLEETPLEPQPIAEPLLVAMEIQPALEVATTDGEQPIFYPVPVENLFPGVANVLADAVEAIVRPVWSLAAPAPTPLHELQYMSARMGGVVRTSGWNVINGFGAILSGTLTMVTGITGCVTRSVTCVVRPLTTSNQTKPTMRQLATH